MADMDKDARVTFRLPRGTRDALEHAAADDRRKVGNLLDAIVSEWLEAKGYLPKPATRRRGGKG
jgi:hypothetical protein